LGVWLGMDKSLHTNGYFFISDLETQSILLRKWNTKMNKRITFIMFIMILIFLSCNGKKETITPEVKNISESVYASGIVKSKNQYEVYPKANGIVNKIAVKEGGFVKTGHLLFSIENPNAKLSVDNARLNAEMNDYYTNSEKLNDAYNSMQLARKNLSNDS
jgi:HlyD family secretion protein